MAMHLETMTPGTITSLLAWWHDAGVDACVDEIPLAWLDRHQGSAAPAMLGTDDQPIMLRPAPALQPAQVTPIPDTVAALTSWLATDASLVEAGPPARRVVASGDPAAKLMIMIDMPEANDHLTGQLLSGETVILFDNMLAAIGLDRGSIYLAALCPARPAAAMIASNTLPRLSEIARKHVALVAPQRLWLLGSAVSRAVLGVDDIATNRSLRDFNHETVKVPTVTSFAPRFLLQNPAQKAIVWADMQVLIGGM
jgi:uracil-DNA glycosylase